jgi:hypothetical protein
MFIELMPLLVGRTVLITVAKVDDKTLRVNLIPTQAGQTKTRLSVHRLPIPVRPRNSTLNSGSIWPATSKPTSKLPAPWPKPKPPWRLPPRQRRRKQSGKQRNARKQRRKHRIRVLLPLQLSPPQQFHVRLRMRLLHHRW